MNWQVRALLLGVILLAYFGFAGWWANKYQLTVTMSTLIVACYLVSLVADMLIDRYQEEKDVERRLGPAFRTTATPLWRIAARGLVWLAVIVFLMAPAARFGFHYLYLGVGPAQLFWWR